MSSSSKRKRQRLQRRDSSDAGAVSSQPQSRASSPAGDAAVPLSKREKFDKRYKVSESTDVEVLSMFAFLLSHSFYSPLKFFPGMQQKTWSSDVYAHFDTPKIVRDTDGIVRYVFSCKRSAAFLHGVEYI